MFRVSQHPSSVVLKTVTAASGTGHNTGTATSLQRGRSGHVAGKYLHTVACGWIFINKEFSIEFEFHVSKNYTGQRLQ